MGKIIIILYIIICIMCFTILLLSDFFVMRKRLKNCRPIMAKLIYFDEIHFFRSGYHVSIVEYTYGEKSKSAVILKGRTDRIGDEIEIVTDGDLAVRKKIVIKEDNNLGVFLIIFVALFLCQQSITAGGEKILFVFFLVIICILIITMIFYPYIHEIFDKEIKKELGWHR